MSTFVDSPLKIELIGTGEQVGTWGTTTNTNLKALQEAITGSVDVDFSGGDVTLTLSDSNSPQSARNLRLRCISASAARTLTLGSGCQIEKLYLVQNDTSFGITIKNTTGTGVTVPAGEKQFVYNDTVNVISATDVNLANAFGTLPIANGGTNGTATPTNGGVAYGTGTAYAFSTAGTSGYALISQGAGSAPTWQQVTNSNTVSTIVARDASGDFTAGTITASLSGSSTSCSGNAATATTLATARDINGTSFDGSASITVPVNTSQKSDNVAYQIPFVTSVTPGNQSLYTDSAASFTYNPSTNTLTVGTLSGSFSGNASTATTLQTARLINNTSFNGSADITVATSVTNASNNADYELALLPGTSTQIYNVYATSAGPTVNAQTGALTVAGGINGNASSATTLSTATGSAPTFGLRAWVNYNGTTATIRDSGNVSSLVAGPSGETRVNFTVGMVDNDYAVAGMAGNGSATRFAGAIIFATGYFTALTESQDGSNTDFVDTTFMVVR